MQYLQLAEGGGYPPPDLPYSLSQGQYDLSQGSPAYMLSEDPLRNYLFVPDGAGGGNWVNVEMFAYMPAAQFEALMDELAPYQPNLDEPGMALFGLGKKAKQWKQQKRQARLEKKNARTEVIRSRADLKRSKAEGIRTGTWKGSGVGDVIKDVTGNITQAAGRIFGGGGGDGSGLTVEGGLDFSNQPPEPSFMQKYGLIIGVVVVGGALLYFATKKR